jgi:hypothetical protein
LLYWRFYNRKRKAMLRSETEPVHTCGVKAAYACHRPKTGAQL